MNTRSTLTLTCCAALLIAAGCSSGTRTVSYTPPQKSVARNNASGAADDRVASAASRSAPAQAEAQPAFTTPEPEMAGEPHLSGAGTGGGKSTRLIGLFGELNVTGPNAGSPLDGAANMSQVTFATEGSCVDPDINRACTMLAFSSTMHRRTSDLYMKPVSGKTVTQLTTDPADDVMPAFSPDGATLAFASNRAGNWDIYTISADGSSTVQLTSDAEHELHPTWSPDGTHIAFCKFGAQSSRWEIWVVNATNPGIRHFLDYGLFPRWCPDPVRNKILFQRSRQRGSRDYSVWTVDYVNGQAMYPTEIVSAANAALINPAWSPDGSRIAFVSVVDPDRMPEGRPTQSDLWMVNLDGSARTSLTNGQFANFQPVWAANGNVYFVSDRSGADNIWAAAAQGGAATSAPSTVVTVDPVTHDPGPGTADMHR